MHHKLFTCLTTIETQHNSCRDYDMASFGTYPQSLLAVFVSIMSPVSFISIVSVKHDKSSLLTMSDMKVVTLRVSQPAPGCFSHPFVFNYLGSKSQEMKSVCDWQMGFLLVKSPSSVYWASVLITSEEWYVQKGNESSRGKCQKYFLWKSIFLWSPFFQGLWAHDRY